MANVPFIGQRTPLTREEAIERYVLLRLRTEDLRRLSFLVEGLYHGSIQLAAGAPFSTADLKDTVRTAFFGWLASLTDKDERVVYAFDPLLVLFPDRRPQIINVQVECEAVHKVLQQFRSNVAFHNRAEFSAHVKARRELRQEDTFLDLESARLDFLRLMEQLVSKELNAIPELRWILEEMGLRNHPAFANVFNPK